MPDLMLVRIPPGDKILSVTEILMKQIIKAQEHDLEQQHGH